ncbi:MAG: hypothetical protein WC617_14040 [Rhodanobacter sp.]|jgi:hypothetical protein
MIDLKEKTDNKIVGGFIHVQVGKYGNFVNAEMCPSTSKQRNKMLQYFLQRTSGDRETVTEDFNNYFETYSKGLEEFIKLKNNQQRKRWLRKNPDKWIVKEAA